MIEARPAESLPEIKTSKTVFRNLLAPALYEHAVARHEAEITAGGALAARTGKHTARSAQDKFIVKEPSSEKHINWGAQNVAIDSDSFDALLRKVTAYLGDKDIYVRDCYAGSDAKNRLKVRVYTELAWHSLFAGHMFIAPAAAELAAFSPDFTVITVPGFNAMPAVDGTRSGTFILLNFRRKIVLIGGTAYAGEIKKSIFSVMNYLLPLKGVMPMHCSANVGKAKDTAIFFGLSGTGKTTLSSDPLRRLIGDDEHGWANSGIFNFEGGCYAKVIKLSAAAEPQIHAATGRFGTILENVVYDPLTRALNLDDGTLTENTRAAYPLEFIDNAIKGAAFPHPKNIVMLTYDAFGVLPPIARLSYEQAMYHFISGYTAKVANTEMGIKEPKATFSTCFGAPFMSHHPAVYAELLEKKMRASKADCWLINTGLCGGPYGTGKRMSIQHTRALLNSALEGKLAKVKFTKDPVFGFGIPAKCPGVPAAILNPRKAWADKALYDAKYRELAALFAANFKKFNVTSKAIAGAGPKI
ncbi:MAG: phosphoenolpyruvate carboxykinase (ATP) [Elusimicrobia bacterium RIFOXYA2_FULL_58_8]|nr:MAG: phosphoenolpyruvate carboxykinase (ATP) [Elusimicrobia bacterium RIFOXYA12_FULL_57_11]OGS14063.1 MAG: phosphoenolpyruvate carboxykinase (ATP) [Elusimicrobia bacterium RIFOXYA2_FULL_58_8]